MGPEHAGVQLRIDPKNPLPFGTPGSDVYIDERRKQLELLRKLNRKAAVEDRPYVTDLHATVLHQLGLDSRRLEIPGHKRLEIDFGQPIAEIIA